MIQSWPMTQPRTAPHQFHLREGSAEGHLQLKREPQKGANLYFYPCIDDDQAYRGSA